MGFCVFDEPAENLVICGGSGKADGGDTHRTVGGLEACRLVHGETMWGCVGCLWALFRYEVSLSDLFLCALSHWNQGAKWHHSIGMKTRKAGSALWFKRQRRF